MKYNANYMENIREIRKDDFYKQVGFENKVKFILQYAVLAPSTHNSQPWLFKIAKKSCKIYLNPKLCLPYADPISRDIHISIGCALENIEIVAKYFHMYKDTLYGPFKEKNLLAEVIMEDSIRDKINIYDNEELLNIIPKRTNARGLFQRKNVGTKTVNELKHIIKNEYEKDNIAVNFIEKPKSIEKIASLTAEGLRTAYRNPSFRREMSHWINHNLSAKKDGIPGYALKMPFILSFILPTLIKFIDIGKKLARLNFISLNSAPMVVIISAKENSYLTWIKTGKIAQRLMLEFTMRNFNTSIFVASIEMGVLYKEVQGLLETNKDFIPQFLFAVGKIDSKHKFTPRHNVIDKIIK